MGVAKLPDDTYEQVKELPRDVDLVDAAPADSRRIERSLGDGKAVRPAARPAPGLPELACRRLAQTRSTSARLRMRELAVGRLHDVYCTPLIAAGLRPDRDRAAAGAGRARELAARVGDPRAVRRTAARASCSRCRAAGARPPSARPRDCSATCSGTTSATCSAETGLALERGPDRRLARRRGGGVARAAGRPARAQLLRAGDRPRPAALGPDRPPPARAARGRGRASPRSPTTRSRARPGACAGG